MTFSFFCYYVRLLNIRSCAIIDPHFFVTMIRPRSCLRTTTGGQLLAFHELDDNADDDNARVGRAIIDDDDDDDEIYAAFSSMSSTSDDDDSTNTNTADDVSSTPILGATPPSIFTKLWSLTIPILPRPFSSRSNSTSTDLPRRPKSSSSQHLHRRRRKRGYVRHHPQDPESVVHISQEWEEAIKYLDSVILQPPVTSTTQKSKDIEPSVGVDKDEGIVTLGIAASPFQTPSRIVGTTKGAAAVTPPTRTSPPFCDGYCSTIVASTPETYVVRTDPPVVGPDFVESPPRPPPPILPTVTPTSSTASEHSNPPYIHPVEVQLSRIVRTKPVTLVLGSSPSPRTVPDNYPKTCRDSGQRSTRGERARYTAYSHQSSAPSQSPVEFWTIETDLGKANPTMDDVSSLGGDSLGETPSRLFHTQERFKCISHTMETSERSTASQRQHKGGREWSWCRCCLAWLPPWMRRIPRVLQYALIVGTALWCMAVALVVLAIVMGRSRNDFTNASSAQQDWQDLYTLPPDDVARPTASPMKTYFPTASAIPTDQPTTTSQPSITSDPGQQTVASTATPSAWPSFSSTFKPTTSGPITSPTMSPSSFTATIVTVPPTQYPTFAPRGGMQKQMGMRRTLSTRK